MDTKFITASRPTLLDNVANRHLLGLEIIPTNSLEGFVQSHGQKLGYSKFIIIDLNGLLDNNDEIVIALNNLKTLHKNMRIIVLADGENEFQGTRSELLRRIWAKGIYNIIVDISETEIEKCILVGKTEAEAKEILSPKPQPAEETANIAALISSKVESSTQAKPSNVEEKILANKAFREAKNYISIGICGTQSHVGATHSALQIVKFLKDIGFKVCYVEAHQYNDIISMREYIPQISFNDKKCMMQYMGINLFYTGFEMARIIADKYDFYVFDLGVLDKDSINQLLMRDMQIVVSGTKPWELVFLKQAIKAIGKDNNVDYLLNFASHVDETASLSVIGNAKNAYFTDYEPNPFAGGVNIAAYKKIFRRYILLEEQPEETQVQKKRWRFFS